ncbi:MAG: holo-ACP synthase [Thermodesulfovibrio sp.]|nr:holo-ACP synthase [Thermodesulfovibrio sp.]
MIEGIGVDIVEVKRIKKIYEKFGVRFLNKVFTEKEVSYSFSYSDPFVHLAARFAAKEAVLKALKKQNRLRLKNIEVINNPDGAPEIYIDGVDKRILLSVSHEKNYALAFVLVLKHY